ncbi:Stc1 domain-containing protein [Cladorrhinum samala]|uniref:Stc1 domain-containing protein n=1 Tax=Cladorrhinum samala TaxID=585594 RepID=A0AAV9HIL8_9PEZI|nr:Stc1 domain-containing protein [Cladorrhinum samala]
MNRHNNISGTIKCMNGGEYRTRDHFSGRSITKYSTALRNGSATRDKSGISCKDHSSGEQDEIHCQGPCNLWRARQYFSNSTRKSGKFWCKMCTEWQTRSEQGEILPPPGSETTAEEGSSDGNENNQGARTARSNQVIYGDNDMHSIICTSATIGEFPTTPTYCTTLVVGDMALIPPHLRPPHLRPTWFNNFQQGHPGNSQASQTASQTSSQAGGSTIMEPAMPARGIPFIGYGPNGQRVNMVREPSEVSAITWSSPEKAVEKTKSGWVKVPQRKQGPIVPEYLAKGYKDQGYKDYDGESEDEP